MNNQFDALVIGAGSGGLAFAKAASKLGKKIALVEQNELGGTCVNLGCVPKKIMYFAADLAHKNHLNSGFGLNTKIQSLDFGKLVEQRSAYIDRIHLSYQNQLKNLNIPVIVGKAEFISDNQIKVNDKKYQAKNFILATGSKAVMPKIQGAQLAINSDGFFALKKLPQKIAIIGAGYIALEIAAVLAALGSQVSILVRSDVVLRSFDQELIQRLIEHLKADGIKFYFNHQIEKIKQNKQNSKNLDLFIQNSKLLGTFDQVLFATSRIPNTDQLALEKAGVTKDQNAAIEVNNHLQTANPNIYAIGDMLNQVQLTPYAIKQGKYLANFLYGNKKMPTIEIDKVPTIVFSHPPLGKIGLTFEEAKEKFAQVKQYRSSFNPMIQSFSTYKKSSLFKLICAGKDEKIVGMHALGEAVDEIMQGFAVAIALNATKSDFDNTVAIHPTSAEEFVTML